MDRRWLWAVLLLAACSPAAVDDLDTGRLPRLLVDPTLLDFGEVPIGEHHSLPVTLQNPASVEVMFQLGPGSIEPCTAEPARFCVERMPERIAAGASSEILVRFTPTVPSQTGALLIVAACNDTRCGTDIEVRGTGVRPRITCEPRPVDFGGVVPGDCLSATLRCTNQGTTLGRLESAAIGPEIFTVTTTFPRTMPPGATAELALEACPARLGVTSGTLTISTDKLPIEIALSTTGIDPELLVVPSALNFGTVALFAPRSSPLILRSTGTTPIEILGFELPPNFAIDANPPLVIDPAEELTVTITFDPTQPGPIDEQVVIRTNDRPQETTVRVGGLAVDLPPCRAGARRSTVDLGPVEIGRLGRAFVAIDNNGAGDCLFYGAHWIGPATPELVQRPPQVSRFGPGETLLIPVELTPAELKSYSARLAIDLSNDGPASSVEINGRGVDNFLRVTPDPIDFGALPDSCAAQSRTVRILRQTDAPGDRIESITIEPLFGDGLSLEALPTLPTLTTAIELQVHFDGSVPLAIAELVIDATIEGISSTQRIPITASKAAAPTQVEHRSQLGSGKLDLLFVVENDFSMMEERLELAASVPGLLAQLDSIGVDYRIGVVTADTGLLLPIAGTAQDRILGPGPNTESHLRTNLSDGTFCFTFDCSKGLEATRMAFANPVRRVENLGFLREEATLSLVYLANHDDQSPRPISDYFDLIRTAKREIDDNRVIATAIVGDPVTGCGFEAVPGGDRYIAFAEVTSGSFISICAHDSSTLGSTSSVLGLRDRFSLAQPPAPGTLEVRIDGSVLPATLPGGTESYRYDASKGVLIFSALAIPEAGADIEIAYQVGCR